MPQNSIEKIVQRFAVNLETDYQVRSGDFIAFRPAYVMTHDNTAAVLQKFRTIGAQKVFDPRQIVFTLDHNVQNTSPENLAKYESIAAFAAEMGIDFYPAGRGIGHQIMCEEGYAWPGTMVVASDSHSNMYGGLGCLGTPVVRTDAAAIWATGQTWWQVPPVTRVVLEGQLRPGVSGKDVIITLCGYFNNDEVLNHVLEFSGNGVKSLSIEQRLTIANMTTEWGALAGVFPLDAKAKTWLENRVSYVEKRGLEGVPSDADGPGGKHPRLNKDRIEELDPASLKADADAEYFQTIILDLDTVQPYVSGPNHVKVMNSAGELSRQNISIQKAYLVSCVNSRLEDLHQAAEIVKGKKVASSVSFYLAPASREVQIESEKDGSWQTLLDAGAIPLPAGCGPCIGLGAGLLEDGEVGISATNRNFKGRMGSKSAQAYLASPAVVAASAIAGKITSPFDGDEYDIEAKLLPEPVVEAAPKTVRLLDGFPESIEGELLFCHQDNLNTDGIYPGKYTYREDISPEEMARVAMENYDPAFQDLAEKGNILVGGQNFGTGSSREQAATSLKYRGITVVLAGSFSQTYKRNAFNNGFLVLEVPELLNVLKNKFGVEALTVNTGMKARIDFRSSKVIVDDQKFSFKPLGSAVQELIIARGLENWVKERL